MKKAFASILVMVALLSFALAEAPLEQTRLVSLTDGDRTLGRCAAPADYKVEHALYCCGEGQSLGFPAQLSVSATSPDGRAAMMYLSAHDYIQIVEASLGGVPYASHQDGALDETTLTPMLTLMSVDGYEDYLMTRLFPGVEVIIHGQETVTDELQARMDAQAQTLYDQACALFASAGNLNVDGCYYGVIERSYSFTQNGEDYLASALAAVSALQYSVVDSLGGQQTRNTTVSWTVPFTYVLVAPSDQFDALRAAYETFVLNTGASDEFNATVQGLSNQIREQVLAARSLTGASSAVERALDSSLDDASYDEERFTDYIYEQNDYELSDGRHVKVSTAYDYVYEDDQGNVFATDSALNEPAGMTRLYGK